MKRKKWEIVLDWALVILVVLVVVVVKGIPTVRKLSGLDKDGIIFALIFSAVLIAVIFISKACEKNHVRNKAEKLNEEFELLREKDEYLDKHGYDKKIGKTILEDLTKRYRKKAIPFAILTVLIAMFGVYAILIGSYSRGAAFLFFTFIPLVCAVYSTKPVKIFKEKFNITSRIPLAEEDYADGKLICKGTAGINIGKRLFVVCFTSKYILIFPIGYIENAARCMVYKTENNRGFLGTKKIEYRLLLNVKQPSTKQGEVYNLELYIPLDKLRLEIAIDALGDHNVYCEREYKYIEKK